MILSFQCHCLKIYVTLKDNYPSNKISIDEATLIEIRLKKKNKGGREVECQLINVEGTAQSENYHLANIIMTTDSGKKHQ